MPTRRRQGSPGLAVPVLPGRPHRAVLDNGLEVLVLENRNAPVVTSAIFYRAGTRDEPAGQGGIAHFLEHLMFKGSEHYGAGEIDRRTQALGGSNNAFTSHDLTAYYFDFAPDRWPEALAIETDRMAGLTLDPAEVASERQVVIEEISMYEGEPWDALELAVHRELFVHHPYALPVLGTRSELLATGPSELAAFHRRFYRPANAVLVVAGDVGPEAVERIEAAFGEAFGGTPAERPCREATLATHGPRRLERAHGEVARLMMGFVAPGAASAEHAALRLVETVLCGGRASRLYRALVDEGQLCAWVTSDLSEGLELSQATVAAELVPGSEPERVEALVRTELDRLRREPPTADELARARQMVLADWLFGHERAHQQALAAGSALALFDLDHPRRQLEQLLAATPEALLAAAQALDPAGRAVVGWSLPDPAEAAEDASEAVA